MTPLGHILRQRIEEHGPIPVSEFMAEALGHPEHGYYRKADPLGRGGDFITAPEISQMFGELIGLWCAVMWKAMGAPEVVPMIELGPGRGTLMGDLLRAAELEPAFRRAIQIHLVETSPALRARQAETLGGEHPTWHDSIDTLPDGPAIFVANEFFDALPIRQFVRRGGVWRERMVKLDGDGFSFAEGVAHEIAAPEAEDGAIFERADASSAVAAKLGGRLATQGGVALVFDYGHFKSAVGETLQAVSRHANAAILSEPGTVDLTAHVDFQALAEAARPARAWGPLTQGAFLRSLGIELRADRLIRANPNQASEIESASRRLIDPTAMGSLFKVLALTQPDLPAPAGFEG